MIHRARRYTDSRYREIIGAVNGLVRRNRLGCRVVIGIRLVVLISPIDSSFKGSGIGSRVVDAQCLIDALISVEILGCGVDA